MIPGEYLLRTEEIEANAGRRTLRLMVRNSGDRPGSSVPGIGAWVSYHASRSCPSRRALASRYGSSMFFRRVTADHIASSVARVMRFL